MRPGPALRQGLFGMLLAAAVLIGATPGWPQPAFHPAAESFPYTALNPERPPDLAPVLDLNGEWQFQAAGRTGDVRLPGSWDGYEGTVTFRRRFEVPDDWQGRRLRLLFLGIHHHATVQVNGVTLETNIPPGVPFTVPLPPELVRFGAANELQVEVSNQRGEKASLPLRSAVFAPRNYGGITREVFLQALPVEYLETLQVREISPPGGEDRQVEVRFTYRLASPETSAVFHALLADSADSVVAEQEITLAGADSAREQVFQLTVPAARVWRPGAPYLYRLTAELRRDERVLDRRRRNVGLRPDPGELAQTLANPGGRASFSGVVRVGHWPGGGISPSPDQLRAELEQILDLGAETVRCAFQPPHPAFLEACDTLGLGVYLEIPLYGASVSILAQREVQEAARRAMRSLQEMAAEHPCVLTLGWGSNLDPKAVTPGGLLAQWSLNLASPWPYYAATLVALGRPGELVLLSGTTVDMPQVPAYLRPGEINAPDLDEQAWRLDRTLHELVGERSAFLAAYLADWVGEEPLMWNPPSWNPLIHRAGVTDLQRQPREVYRRLKGFMGGGYPDLHAPEPRGAGMVWEYLAFGLAFSVAVAWLIRIDRSWRKNLRRALTHFQGLVGDIRNRRFQQGAQTALLAILVAAGIGNLWAVQLHHHRLDPGLSAALPHFLNHSGLLALVRNNIWQPMQGIFFLTMLVLGLAVIYSLAMRLACHRQRLRFTFGQSFYLVAWSGVPALAVLPLSMIYLPLAAVPWLQWIVVVAAYWSLLWSYARSLGAMQRACRGYLARPLMVGLGLPLLLLLAYLAHLQVTRETLYYLGFFVRLFAAG